MWKEPSADEINRWRLRLENRGFQQSLLTFQDWVYRVFEEHRKMTGNRLIRAVLSRHTVKSLESVISKIRKRRQKLEGVRQLYDFQMIDDLVGIKILCPYESSAKEVMKWMLQQEEKFRVTPRSIEKAYTEHSRGYRGWHFIATPISGREPKWVGVRCELQVKTMLQEAWDAQTHSITYKREEEIDPGLLKAMRDHSRALQERDRKAEALRKEIQRVEEIEERMKNAAAAVYFWKGEKMLREMEGEFNFEVADKSSLLKCKPLPPGIVSSLNRAIETYFRKGRLLDRDNKKGRPLTGHLCHVAAQLALCQRDPTQESMAVWLAEELVHRVPTDPRAEDIKAGVLWGLNRLEEAVASGREALKKITEKYDELSRNVIEQNYCYWVAELARAGRDVEGSVQGEVMEKADKLLEAYSAEPQFNDTVGFVKICLGRSRDEVMEGLRLAKKAYRGAMQSQVDKKLALPFRQRHEAIAYRRLERWP